jgi:hypothetical protein
MTTYLAADSHKEVNVVNIVSPNNTLDYVVKQTPPGLPSHTLTVKVNGIYRLIHNFSIHCGLVKHVCVIMTEVGNWLITI